MSLSKHSSRSGKKAGGGARRSHSKKPTVAKKTSGPGSSASSKTVKKHSKSSAAFSSLKSKQMTVERLKRSGWASVQQITEAIIRHATTGNVAAAKELFDFAGVYSLPMPDDENAAAAPAPPALPAAEVVAPPAALVHPIDLFFKKIGVEPSNAEPEPEAA